MGEDGANVCDPCELRDDSASLCDSCAEWHAYGVKRNLLPKRRDQSPVPFFNSSRTYAWDANTRKMILSFTEVFGCK